MMAIEEVEIYISYDDIPQCPDKVTSLLQLNGSKHWAVVLKSKNWCMRLELNMDVNREIQPIYRGIHFREYVGNEKNLHRLATYFGSIEDINFVVENHEMNTTKYSIVNNNCQHYVATTLSRLSSFQDTRDGRKMCNFSQEYSKMMGVLGREKMCGGFEHVSNKVVKTSVTGLKGFVSALGVHLIAQTTEKVTVAAIPYSGIMGLLGLTKNVTTVAILPAPIFVSLGVVLIVGSMYITPEAVEQAVGKKRKLESNIMETNSMSKHKKGKILS
jgi:hypothetical protein